MVRTGWGDPKSSHSHGHRWTQRSVDQGAQSGEQTLVFLSRKVPTLGSGSSPQPLGGTSELLGLWGAPYSFQIRAQAAASGPCVLCFVSFVVVVDVHGTGFSIF